MPAAVDTPQATALVPPYLAPDGCIVSLQNSINEDAIAAIAGCCSVNVLATKLVAPGRIERGLLRPDPTLARAL